MEVGGGGGGLVEMMGQRAEALGVGVGSTRDGEDDGHKDGGPGKFVVRGKRQVAHTAWLMQVAGHSVCGGSCADKRRLTNSLER